MSQQHERSSLLRAWRSIEASLIGALVVIALGIFLYGSLIRTVSPGLALDWAEEVTIYLIVWATLLSGGTLAGERDHVSAQILVHRLSPPMRARLRVCIDLLTLGFCCVLVWLGIEAVAFANMLDERSASSLQAPQAWVLYLALPVSMLLIAVRIVLLLLPGRRAEDG